MVPYLKSTKVDMQSMTQSNGRHKGEEQKKKEKKVGSQLYKFYKKW